MAVLPMKKVSIMGMKSDEQPILDLLQRLEIVDIETAPDGGGVFALQEKEESAEKVAGLKRDADTILGALSLLSVYAPEKSSLFASLEGRKSLSGATFGQKAEGVGHSLETAKKLLELERELISVRASRPKIENERASLVPWADLKLPLNFSGTARTTAWIGSFPDKRTEEEITVSLVKEADTDELQADVIHEGDDMTAVMVTTLSEHEGEVDSALRRLNFSRAPGLESVPSERMKELDREEAEVSEKEEKLISEIASYGNEREGMKFALDYYAMESAKCETESRIARSGRTFYLTGYTPVKTAEILEEKLKAYDAVVVIDDPSEADDVPVLFTNNSFAAPVEGVVENFSMPGKGEIDPSMAVACFYYVLFGMMLSDAAYGAIIAIACGLILLKFKNMETPLKKTITMFFFCGLGTILSGILFGSFFGDAIQQISRTFFGREVAVWCWINPLEQPMKMLVLAFCVAVVHLFTGLALLIYTNVKNGQVKDAIYDGVFWYMLVGGLILFGLTTDMVLNMLQLQSLKETYPPILGSIGIALAAVGAVGIILTGGRESRNWFKRILKGAYALYGVTGYLSDILSYSRLLALGLATSVISSVFNQMGTMGGSNFGGVIMFILIFIVGHALNLAINALGAYVHTNRLTFVEFFGKFYNGGGRKFLPLAMNTKYYKIKEEQ
ncbi:MAG: V-type ATP synthase subunit I [Lachnospiraceae bacterium]|nr:V-type ATP synthase subunit I [Lachnospiraceae bacterium]